MQKKRNRSGTWCACALLVLGASACAVTDEDPANDDTLTAQTSQNEASHAQPEATSARSTNDSGPELMDPCTALIGCIATAVQNGNGWLVDQCWAVLGQACFPN